MRSLKYDHYKLFKKRTNFYSIQNKNQNKKKHVLMKQMEISFDKMSVCYQHGFRLHLNSKKQTVCFFAIAKYSELSFNKITLNNLFKLIAQ